MRLLVGTLPRKCHSIRQALAHALKAVTTDPDNFCGRAFNADIIRTPREKEREIMRVSNNHAKKSEGRIGQSDGLQLFLAHGRPAAVDSITIFIRFKVLLNFVVNKSTRNLPAASSLD